MTLFNRVVPDVFRRKIDECKQKLYAAASATKNNQSKRGSHGMHNAMYMMLPQQHLARYDENQAMLPAVRYTCHHPCYCSMARRQ